MNWFFIFTVVSHILLFVVVAPGVGYWLHLRRKRRRRLVSAALSLINNHRKQMNVMSELDPRERRRMYMPDHMNYVKLMNELIDATKDVN